MKILFIVSTVIYQMLGAPLPEEAQATIIEYDSTNDGKGNYKFSFLTSNGIRRKESGKLVNVGQPGEHIEVQGMVSYRDSDGKVVVIYYTAGEKGYRVASQPPARKHMQRISPNVVASLLGK